MEGVSETLFGHPCRSGRHLDPQDWCEDTWPLMHIVDERCIVVLGDFYKGNYTALFFPIKDMQFVLSGVEGKAVPDLQSGRDWLQQKVSEWFSADEEQHEDAVKAPVPPIWFGR